MKNRLDIRHPATIERQDDGRYFVQCIDLPETLTEGESKEEALFNAAEVLSAMLAFRLENEKDVPAPSSKVRGITYIAPDARTQAAMLLRLVQGERTLADLARALATSWPAAKRLENPRHWTSLKSLERAAAAHGKCLVLHLE